jgi:type I restriction enzyme S subunit
MKVAENNAQSLPKGYKQTEVGLIPSDWEIVLLENLTTKIGSGITPTGGASVYKEDGRPFVRSQNVGWGNLILDDVAFIDDETHQTFPNTEIKINDVFLNISGASIGRSSYASEKLIGGNVNQHVCIIRNIESKLNPIFLNLFLLSKSGQKQIDSFQSGGNRQGLNIGQIRTFLIPIPSTLEEQTAIATAISDADALISSLVALLAKKRNIKQGAMQKLMQPKEAWEVKKLPEIVWFQEGPGVRNSQFTSSGVKLLNGTNIEDGKLLLEKTERYISENEAFGWYSHFLVDDGDILIACSGVTIDKFEEKVTVANNTHLPLCMNTSTMRFKIISDTLSKNYFLHFLKSKSFKQQIGGKATGSAQLNFGPSHVKMVEIALPNFKEQESIATILSDMDNEITALETKLEKYRKVKLGMMQELLTGKIRLV